MQQTVLLTGGAGYIGSHTYVALAAAGFFPIILDDLSNSQLAVLKRLESITGRPVAFERFNVQDTARVESVLRRNNVAAVIHFAGFKAVGESVEQPLRYYNNNVGGTVSLLRAMDAANCRLLVFSSSATVYGDSAVVPLSEDFPRSHTNPYGHSKLVCEDILAATGASNEAWRFGVLRYFNPVGAHASGLIGEDPVGTPNNLLPYVAQVAMGRRQHLNIYGEDYATPDGTGVRDYIHVMDLAEGHVAALRVLVRGEPGFTVNLGSGKGHSVLEVVRAFELASGRPVPYRFAPRRAGDVAQCYANPALAEKLLGWRARRTLAEMCGDGWKWQEANPRGYTAR